MLKKLLASTAFAALIAGGAYAQTTERSSDTQQLQVQDRPDSSEIHVRSGDTITLESVDIEFTLRFTSEPDASGGVMASDGDQAADAASEGTAEDAEETSAAAPAEESAGNAGDETAATDEMSDETVAESPAGTGSDVDAERMAGEMLVGDGDTVVVATEGESFQLNFQIRDEESMAAVQQDQPSDSAEVAAVDEDAATETDDTVTSAINRENLQARGLDQIRADELIGSTVYGANEEDIGDVGDVIMSQDGQVEAILVDVGGFLGIGTREVAIGLDNIEFMVDDRENWFVYTPFTQDQLENQPEYDKDTYAQDRDRQLLIVR